MYTCGYVAVAMCFNQIQETEFSTSTWLLNIVLVLVDEEKPTVTCVY